MLVYLALALLGDRDTLRAGLRLIGPGQWALLLALSLLNYLLRFLRWRRYLCALGSCLPVRQDVLIYLAGFAFTVTPGKAGEAVRSVYLREAGVPWSHGLAALAVERLLDLAVMLLLAVLVLDLFGLHGGLIGLFAVLLALGLVGMTRPAVVRKLLNWVPDQGHFGQLLHGFFAILADARALLAPGLLIQGLSLGLLAWAAEGFGVFLTLSWLGVDLQPARAIGLYAASVLAGALSFLPGGLGGTEAAMIALLVSVGAVLGTAVLATLICRLVTLWFAVLLGILVLPMIQTENSHVVDSP